MRWCKKKEERIRTAKKILIFWRFSYGFLTIFLRFSYDFLTYFSWYFDDFCTIFVRFLYDFLTIFLRFSCDSLTIFLRFSYIFLTIFRRFLYDFLISHFLNISHFKKHQEFELVSRKGQCCGECVPTKCSFNKRLYKIGEMWKSDDNCTFYECSKSRSGNEDDYVISAKINKYKKTCPPLGECPTNRIVIKDCCQTCQLDPKPANENQMSDFVHSTDRDSIIMSRDTYLNHPCRRKCRQGEPPKICNYTFMVR